jgi:hypothetical protein
MIDNRKRRGVMHRRTMGVIPGRLVLLMILSIWLGSVTAHAQEFQAGIDFITVIPKGQFKQNIKNSGYGGGGQFLVRVRQSPFLLGVDLGIVNYGSVSRKEPILPSIPDVRVDVSTDNNIFLTHFLVRAQPRRGNVRPYIDGLLGLKHLFTQTSIRGNFDDGAIASETNLSDTSLSYGVGGGVQISLYKKPAKAEVLLDGKVRYLRGSRARYLKEGSIRRENGMVFFDVLSSRTDVVGLQVGVTFQF